MLPYYLYSSLPPLSDHKVFAQIDVEALVYNYKLLCSYTKGTHHICVVKADAYGHVSDVCTSALLDAGCRFFAVSCIEEAISVRKVCREKETDADILILGYTDCRQAALLSENDIIQTALSFEYARTLNSEAEAKNCCVRIHAALDTGMNRIGISTCSDEECFKAAILVKKINKFNNLSLEGLFTHFARADEDEELDMSCTKKQFDRFMSVKNMLAESGIDLFCHVCNSAAAVKFPELALDGVRFGIMLYGVDTVGKNLGLRPVMSLKTVVSHIHTLLAGEAVSYGGNYTSDTERTIATLPLGYADGFVRAYSGFKVTVTTSDGNFKAPVVGRICMDQCMIDVTGIPVKVGDVVTIFGDNSEDLFELAKRAGTIEYECLALVSARVPRVIKGNF